MLKKLTIKLKNKDIDNNNDCNTSEVNNKTKSHDNRHADIKELLLGLFNNKYRRVCKEL